MRPAHATPAIVIKTCISVFFDITERIFMLILVNQLHNLSLKR